ncbi:MAG: N-acetylneuraminate synthase family protein [Hyphomicrobium sp.]
MAMVDAAAEAGADCVKFQAFDPDTLIARGTRAAAYQARNTGEVDQLALIRSLALGRHDFEKIASRCQSRKIEFLATAFDVGMLEFLVGLGMRRTKIASGELTNRPSLLACARQGLPVLLSTGMATDEEVDWAVSVLMSAGTGSVTILQCTSIYPAPIHVANLRAMVAMGARHGLPFGYSDHTLGDHVSCAAVAIGACVIEKHFTLDRTLPGPDHSASLTPDELGLMVVKLRDVSASLGSAHKAPDEEELATAALVRRSWHAARDLVPGVRIADGDGILLRPASGVSASESVVGRIPVRAIAAGEPIRSADLGSH